MTDDIPNSCELHKSIDRSIKSIMKKNPSSDVRFCHSLPPSGGFSRPRAHKKHLDSLPYQNPC